MSELKQLTKSALVGASMLIDATQEELDDLNAQVELAIEALEANSTPQSHPAPAVFVPELTDIRFRRAVGFEVQTRGGEIPTFVTYQLPDHRSQRDATLDVTVHQLIDDLIWMHDAALQVAAERSPALRHCRPPRDIHIVLLEYDTMTQPNRFPFQNDHPFLYGFFIPPFGFRPEGHTYIGIPSSPARVRQETLVHELGHYWWAQLCLQSTGINSEEFAQLVERRAR